MIGRERYRRRECLDCHERFTTYERLQIFDTTIGGKKVKRKYTKHLKSTDCVP
jgi:transcriptional regulator NrdR family protein